MKSKYTEQENQIITAIADMYSNNGKGLNKARRALRKKFSIAVSEGELKRRLYILNKKRERAT
tara:strand:+ start:2966 stop:3154 length:189 start_codon:yes stop_codon:yes gene_type:complete